MTRITTPTESFVVCYPEAVEYMRNQSHVFWPFDEVKVGKDVQDIITNLTEQERHGVITVLKLFTLYEQRVGEDYWLGKVMKWFPRPEIQGMAAMFGAMELSVHGPFYKQLNVELGLDTDDFYLSYVNDPALSERMRFINEMIDSEDKLLSLAVFSMVEGAVLYSNFSYLKHFQSQGKNKLKNGVAGINFSVRDENLHSEAGAWLYRTYWKELGGYAASDVGKEFYASQIIQAAKEIYKHEEVIIEKIFEKGPIKGITAHQLQEFVKSRINFCLKNLGVQPIFDVSYNPIADWFYKGINSYKSIDFFDRQGNEYKRGWREEGFVW